MKISYTLIVLLSHLLYIHKYFQQESIPVGCVPPAFLIPGEGISPYRDLPIQITTLDTDPSGQRPFLDRDSPGRNMGPGTETPLEGTWDQAVRQEVTSCRTPLPPVVDR